MTYDAVRRHRRSIRLRRYDYSSSGAYFVTVCTKDRVCIFGEVVGGEMRLNDAGRIVHEAWGMLPNQYPAMEIDAFVVMPNHVHGVIILKADGNQETSTSVGAIHELPLRRLRVQELPLTRRRMTIPLVLGRFKMLAAKQINGWRKTPGLPVWQRNYYEHVVRDDSELDRIRQYIAGNPESWAIDRENPAAANTEPEEAWAE